MQARWCRAVLAVGLIAWAAGVARLACAQAPGDPATVALWLFDETQYPYTPLADASLHGQDLRLLPEGELVAGRYGRCLRLEPGPGYHAYYAEWKGMVAPRFMARAPGTPSGLWGPTITPGLLVSTVAALEWTCEFWLKLGAMPRAPAAVLHLGYGYDPGFEIDLEGEAAAFTLRNAYGGWSARCPIGLAGLSDGAWHHVAFTVSATGNRVRLFLDAQLEPGSAWTASPRQPVPALLAPPSLASTTYGIFDNSLDYERFRQGRFNLSLGENRHGAADLDGWLDELRISAGVRYPGHFAPPDSFARNYGTNAPPDSTPTGPPLLFGLDAPVGPVALGTRRHLFIDGALLETTEHLRWTVNPPRVEALTHVFGGDYSAVDHAGKVWLVTPDGYESDRGQTRLWESHDGLLFTAPDLGLIEEGGSRHNNLILEGTPMWARAFRDTNPNAPEAERFKMTAWVANSGIHLYTSSDLIRWRRNETLLLPLVSGGGAEAYFDDQQGFYQLFIKRDPDFASATCPSAGGRTAVGFQSRAAGKAWPFTVLTNPCFASWTSPLVTCEGPVVFGVNADGEVYRTRAIQYEWAPDVYLAFLWRFASNTQVRQTELAVSRDGTRWIGLASLGMYLPTGLVVGGVSTVEGLAQQGLIRRGNELWQYAEFNTGPHGAGAKKLTARLVQRRDGFVSLDSGALTGVATTRPLTTAGRLLTLNLDARQGATRVGLLDESGAPLPGFGVEDCDPITVDAVDYVVTWHGGSALPSLGGRVVRLRFEMSRTKLYALQFGTPRPVFVGGFEHWNGLENPHAADGVTLRGAGTPEDPYIYAIPAGMRLAPSGVIRLSADLTAPNPSEDTSIQFQFLAGGLHLDTGAVIDVVRPARSGQREFILDLGGGDFTGAGRILGLRGPGERRMQKPRDVTIRNARDVSLLDVDLHTENVADGLRGFSCTAAGRVTIKGRIDTSDLDPGGNTAGNIAIRAAQLELNHADTRAFRTDGTVANGSIELTALDPGAAYNPASSANRFTNRLILNGRLDTAGTGPTLNAPVRLEAVVLQLGGGCGLTLPARGTATLRAGRTDLGATARDLFVNASTLNPAVSFVTAWDGRAPVGQGPAFTGPWIVREAALADSAYRSTVAGTATDLDGDTLSYAKGAGPAWLSVERNGTLHGMPAVTDRGTNTWTVTVTDGSRFALATLEILVRTAPAFLTDAISLPDGAHGTAYDGSLAGWVHDSDGDSLTFAKESGPDWLTVGPDGALSGVPGEADTFANNWIVSVTDGQTTRAAEVFINVCGPPGLRAGAMPLAAARVNEEYAGTGQSLVDQAADPCGEPLSFQKLSGPAWLSLFPSGALAGVPTAADAGTSTWQVSVTDGHYSTLASLQIEVLPALAPIVISRIEQWDGVQNPHAAEGVTLHGTGTDGDPAIYTIPTTLHLARTGGIVLSRPPPAGGEDQPPDNNIVLAFSAGDLVMDSGAVLNVGRRTRSGRKTAVLALGGGSIKGAGRIAGILNSLSTPRVLTIHSVRDVQLAAIDLHVENVNNGGRPFTLTASGRVEIGAIDNSDRDPMGNDAGDINVKAESIAIGSLNTAAYRPDGAAKNGDIRITALAAPQFDAHAAEANHARHRLVLSGLLFTAGPANRPGNAYLQGVVVELRPGFQARLAAGAKLTLDAGRYPNGVGARAADLFVDRASSGLGASHVVAWSGALSPSLEILSAGEQVLLYWQDAEYRLQESATLANPAGWVEVPVGSPAVRTIGPDARFFRLRRQTPKE